MMRALIAAGVLVVVLMLAADRKSWLLPPAGEPYRPLFDAAAARYGVPVQLLERVAQEESHFDATATNAASGAAGMMQLIPRFYPDVDPYNPAEAIPAAARSLRHYHDQFGTWTLALAAYNWGPGNLSGAIAGNLPFDRWPLETQDYVTDITGDTGIA